MIFYDNPEINLIRQCLGTCAKYYGLSVVQIAAVGCKVQPDQLGPRQPGRIQQQPIRDSALVLKTVLKPNIIFNLSGHFIYFYNRKIISKALFSS
jgi:hypothetical protein